MEEAACGVKLLFTYTRGKVQWREGWKYWSKNKELIKACGDASELMIDCMFKCSPMVDQWLANHRCGCNSAVSCSIAAEEVHVSCGTQVT